MTHKDIAMVLHRLNLSYTRPTYLLKKAHKEKQELFEDEAMVRDYQAIQKTLAKKDEL